MSDKDFSLKSIGAKIIVGVVVALVVGGVSAAANGWFENSPPSNKEIKSGVMSALHVYENDVNKGFFDAEKYFAPDVDLFFRMNTTTPSGINKYWKENFYSTFSGTKIRYDESTLNIVSAKDDCYYVSIVMYSDYYNIKTKKQAMNERTRFEFKFNNDFRIFYMKQFLY